MSRALSRAGLALVALLSALAISASGAYAQLDRPYLGQDVPYVPTPANVVEAMLEIAKVGPNDFVIDLGSGDGRIVIAAARQRGARGFGVEIVPSLVNDARREAQRQAVSDRVRFVTENLFITDIAQATVLTAYLYPNVLYQLRPRIFEQLQPGTRVVSHEFDFGSWKPDAQVRVSVPDKPYGPPVSDVYLWIVPANAAGRWQWRMAVNAAETVCELSAADVSGARRHPAGRREACSDREPAAARKRHPVSRLIDRQRARSAPDTCGCRIRRYHTRHSTPYRRRRRGNMAGVARRERQNRNRRGGRKPAACRSRIKRMVIHVLE